MEMAPQSLLCKISEYQFVCVELQLYLDTHPDDEDARADYLCYADKLEELIGEYEMQCGPLLNFGISSAPTGSWALSKWPWEV